MRKKKVLAFAAVGAGSLIACAGLALVILYIVEAVIARAGEPDQSLSFWYLPLLFIGGFGTVCGLGLAGWGVYWLRKQRTLREDAGGDTA